MLSESVHGGGGASLCSLLNIEQWLYIARKPDIGMNILHSFYIYLHIKSYYLEI